MTTIKKSFPIVLASDENYAIPLGIAIFSILQNRVNNYNIEFFILEDGISENEKNKIKKLINSFSCKVTFIPINKILKDQNLPERGYLRKIAYARIFIPDIVNREKVIYLDTDIIVNSDILELFEQNFESVFLALREPDERKILTKKNDPMLHNYFNSGVMVINTKKWIENRITERTIDFINKYPMKIEFADQDALNYICQDLWDELDRKFNYEIIYNEPYRNLNPIITHYIGSIKPWHYEYPNRISNYREYAQMSPWKDNWKTKKTFKKMFCKMWMIFKLELKKVPGLKNLITKIKYTVCKKK